MIRHLSLQLQTLLGDIYRLFRLLSYQLNDIPLELKELARYLNNIPNINQGGCLVAASFLYLEASKLGLKPQIVGLSRTIINKKFITSLDELKQESLPNHFAVLIGGTLDI